MTCSVLLPVCNESGQDTRAATSYRADHGYPHRIEDVIHDVDSLIAIDDWLAVLDRAGCHAASFRTSKRGLMGEIAVFVYSHLRLRVGCSSV